MAKTIILIAGPTAVGKTNLSIQLAKHFQTEIISADSRQCYRELTIGVAKPSLIELQEVPHHFINSNSIQEEITAASFETFALQKADELFKKYDTVIMAGGTGLYIKAFCEGMDLIPEVDETIRKHLQEQYQQYGLKWLQEELQLQDSLYAQSGEMQNPQRMLRALEIVSATGTSILKYRKGEKQQRNFQIIKIGLELPRSELYDRINKRVDQMMELGLLTEVKSLVPFRKLNALQTVGYKELFEFIDGTYSLQHAIDKIKQNSRHYAKRQLTWFKRDTEMKWFHPEVIEEIIQFINSQKKPE